LIVDLKPWNIGTAVIGKSDGSMLYISRDIAAAQDRFKQFDFDAMFYVVAVQQDHHFKVFYFLI
jgi:arginyl-tRNA synthetase